MVALVAVARADRDALGKPKGARAHHSNALFRLYLEFTEWNVFHMSSQVGFAVSDAPCSSTLKHFLEFRLKALHGSILSRI